MSLRSPHLSCQHKEETCGNLNDLSIDAKVNQEKIFEEASLLVHEINCLTRSVLVACSIFFAGLTKCKHIFLIRLGKPVGDHFSILLPEHGSVTLLFVVVVLVIITAPELLVCELSFEPERGEQGERQRFLCCTCTTGTRPTSSVSCKKDLLRYFIFCSFYVVVVEEWVAFFVLVPPPQSQP